VSWIQLAHDRAEPSNLVLGKMKGRKFFDKFTSCGIFVMCYAVK